jgi:hypothetical protein
MEYEFGSPRQLLGTANRPELQADEKPIYATTDDMSESDVMGQTTDGEGVSLQKVESHKLIYNPESGRVFHAATDEYQPISPPEFIGPLVEELTERDRTDLYGTMWVRDGGARAYAQVLFEDTHSIHLPGRGRSDPVRCGFTLRWSHDGGVSVRARGFAQDTQCSNSIRQVTSPMHVKHSGDVDGRVDWRETWAEMLDQLGAFSEGLQQVIGDAIETDFFDFTEDFEHFWRDSIDLHDSFEGELDDLAPGPLAGRDVHSVAGFYGATLPTYLAQAAADRLMWRLGQQNDPRSASAWDVYSAATYALTHEARGVAGASDDDKFRAVKDYLMNPAKAYDDAERKVREPVTPGDGPQLQDPEEIGIAETEGEALREYSERSRQLEQSFGGD